MNKVELMSMYGKVIKKRYDDFEIEILMKDGCTRSEAIRFINKGTQILSDFEENFVSYMEDLGIEESDLQMYEQMIKEKKPVEDWGIVEYENKTYYIIYIL